jgi:predicted transcriptional regulator
MLSIWIEPEARERLDRIAERDRRSVSSVVRLAIEFYLVGHGKESGEAAA